MPGMDWEVAATGSRRHRASEQIILGVMQASLVEACEHSKSAKQCYGIRKTKPVLALIILAAGMDLELS